jgi:deoxyribose-phosphate aldolase
VTTGPNIDLLADLIAAELRAQLTSGTSSVLGACDRCDGAHCVTHCADKVQRLAACGADRFTAGPGIDACDNVLARMIDHTLLAPTASQDEIEALCDEAVEFCFATVCINPWWVRLAAERLATTPVRVCTVIGFPLGANRSETKAYEAIRALEDGASELDMVINVGALRSGAYSEVERDIRSVVEAARRRAKVKVIIEAAHLNDEEKVKACVLAQAAGAHFVKTSTGFGPGGATEADIRLMRRAVGGELGVKAAGGVGDQPTALKMIKAGATRIGASAGVKIVRGNGAGPERPYGATAAEPSSSGNGDIRATVIPAPRATIHKLG